MNDEEIFYFKYYFEFFEKYKLTLNKDAIFYKNYNIYCDFCSKCILSKTLPDDFFKSTSMLGKHLFTHSKKIETFLVFK